MQEIIATLRDQGLSYAAISKATGVSPSVVAWNCVKMGLSGKLTAQRLGRPPASGRAFTPQEDAQIAEMRMDGASIGQIATALGRRKSSVHWRLFALARHDEISAAA